MKYPNRLWLVVLGGIVLSVIAIPEAICDPAQPVLNDLPPGIVAAQGGVQVSLKDIDAFAEKMPAKDRAGFFNSPKRIESVIMGMLLNRQLAAKARSSKLDQEPEVKHQIELETTDTLARIQLERYRENLKLPSFTELAQEYYLSHKSEFVHTGDVQVKHVLVSNKDRSDDDAKTRIGKVEASARAHPEQFDALINQYSDDPSAKNNHGLIDNAASSNMAAPFAKAAAALKKPGDVSPIVKTQFGYHVLKLVKHEPDTQQTFDQVKKTLIAKLQNEWIDAQVNEYTGKMRGNELHANPDLVASLRTRFLAPGTVLPEQAAREAREKAATESKSEATGKDP